MRLTKLLLLLLISTPLLLGCTSLPGTRQPLPPPEAPAPIVWPSACLQHQQPMPPPPDAPALPKTATEAQKRDVYEAVLRGFVDLLQAWGANGWETQDACAAKHRELAH